MNGMTEFRLHGRGGQGIVAAAAIFAEAVFREGRHARAFSLFGAERRGAPVTAFIRVSDSPLMPRCRIYRPDYVAVLDVTLSSSAVRSGLKEGGVLLINAPDSRSIAGLVEELNPAGAVKLYTVSATAIAVKHNLTIGGFPMVNTVIIGALARISGLAGLRSVEEAVAGRVSSRREGNLRAAAEGFAAVREVSCLAR